MSPATLETVNNLMNVQFNLISTNIIKLGYEWLGHGRSLLVYGSLSVFILLIIALAISSGYLYIFMFIFTHFLGLLNKI